MNTTRHTVRVIFENPGYNFVTTITGTFEDIYDYYLRNHFNMGTVDDDMQKPVDVHFLG